LLEFMALSPSSFQVAGNRPHHEEGDDIGEDDGDDATGRSSAHVVFQQRPDIDQEGQISRLRKNVPFRVVRGL
jgi:hypothetical protein